jgi:hypothetical protein
MSVHDHLTADDFILIIRPVKSSEDIDENEEETQGWTGEVQVAIIADAQNSSLAEAEFSNMIALCNCTAASIPAMEENAFIREIIQSYAHNRLISPVQERLAKYTDNVLHIHTDTKGTA